MNYILVMMLIKLSLLTFSMIFWWTLFFFTTMLFLWILKESYYSLVVYFIVQEVSGLMFLLAAGGPLSFWMILLKLGVSPLHFWVFSLMSSLKAYKLMWFNTMQKAPYFYPLCVMFLNSSRVVVVLGKLILILQLFLVKKLLGMFTLGAMESFNLIVLCLEKDSFMNMILVFFYWSTFWFVMSVSLEEPLFMYSMDTVYWQMSFPLGLPFLLKFITFCGILMSGWGILVLLLMMLGVTVTIWSYLIVTISNTKISGFSSIFPILMSKVVFMLIFL